MKALRQIEVLLSCLHDAIRALTEQKKTEFEWFRSHHGFATGQDLEEMEARLLRAIVENSGVTPSIEAAVTMAQTALDKLDASIPDKKE